jgi:hypothetical protein
MNVLALGRTPEIVRRFLAGKGVGAIAMCDEQGRPTGQVFVALPLGAFRAMHRLHCASRDWTPKVAALAPWPAAQLFCIELKMSFDLWQRAAPMEGRA